MECRCNWKNWLLSSGVVAIAFFLLDWFFHGTLMMDRYIETANLWRPLEEMADYFWVGIAGKVLIACTMTSIFAYGYEAGKSKVGQGLRFGIMAGLLFWGGQLLMSFQYMPIPGDIYINWFLIGMIEFTLLGTLIGFLYKTWHHPKIQP